MALGESFEKHCGSKERCAHGRLQPLTSTAKGMVVKKSFFFMAAMRKEDILCIKNKASQYLKNDLIKEVFE